MTTILGEEYFNQGTGHGQKISVNGAIQIIDIEKPAASPYQINFKIYPQEGKSLDIAFTDQSILDSGGAKFSTIQSSTEGNFKVDFSQPVLLIRTTNLDDYADAYINVATSTCAGKNAAASSGVTSLGDDNTGAGSKSRKWKQILYIGIILLVLIFAFLMVRNK